MCLIDRYGRDLHGIRAIVEKRSPSTRIRGERRWASSEREERRRGKGSFGRSVPVNPVRFRGRSSGKVRTGGKGCSYIGKTRSILSEKRDRPGNPAQSGNVIWV